MKIRNGNVKVNHFIGNPYDIDFEKFLDNEDLLKIEYGEYEIAVKNQLTGMFKVLISKGGSINKPIIKQEVGDFESLQFTLQNYIDLLASFNERK